MEFEFFIGTDVSKKELDFAVRMGKQLLFHREIANEPAAINAFLKELSKLPGFDLSKAVFCMEHTGIYNNHLLVCLHKKKANICLEAATHIKKSLGNIRGKNDKIDSIRIAEYAYDKREKLRMWAPKREIVQQLSHLAATRSRLLKVKKILKTPLQEAGPFVKKSIAKQNLKVCIGTLNAIEADLKKVEKEIDKIISSDPELKRIFSLVTSVCSIGAVIATQVLISTNEFKDLIDAKQFACMGGMAPFTEESGIFKGKGRVSHMANKKIKTLFHMAALVAIQHDPELKLFFERKVNQDKKNKMSVLNAVRNKLILRIFACVNQNRKYEKNYARLVT
ncbi:MAG: IS110 family transposase [Sphingobacteriales bacterium]